MIIGLYGDSGSGKDTIAKIALVKRGFDWRSFAVALREVLYQINPWLPEIDMEYAEAIDNFGLDWVKKNSHLSVEYMIRLGQAARTIIDENVWVRPVLDSNLPLPKNMVISDVRQPNEYEAIKNAGGEVWKVIRPGTVRRSMDGLLDHLYFPVTIYNGGDIDDLERIVCKEIDAALHRD